MSGKVTIATVARHARVSRQTVSNVINSPHLVREETRERVRAAIADLGYRANQAARQMRTGRSRLIAVRIEPSRDGINGSILDRFLHGLTEAAAPAGYRIMLYTAADDATEIATYDALLAAYDLDAFVLTSTHHGDARTSWLAERGVPFVTFGRPWGAPERHSWVDVDGAAGTAEATRRLLAAGHRRIGFLGWPAGSGVGDDRLRGWHRALTEAGLADPSAGAAGVPRPPVSNPTEAGLAGGPRPPVSNPTDAGLADPADGAAGLPRSPVSSPRELGALTGEPAQAAPRPPVSGPMDAGLADPAAGAAGLPRSPVSSPRELGALTGEPAHGAPTGERPATAPGAGELEGLVRRTADRVVDAEAAAADLLAIPDPPTALVCASDSLALGALRATAGRTPAVAVIGFDDTPVAQAIGLTSVGQPLAEAAARCVELLARLLDRPTDPDGAPAAPEHVLLRPRLVVRDSG